MAKAKVLTKDEIRRVMRIAETGNNGLRDRVALSLSIMAGMRIGEVAALTIGDVRGLDGKAVSVINLSRHQTKGSKSRTARLRLC
jgi:integrase/recombinase XerD